MLLELVFHTVVVVVVVVVVVFVIHCYSEVCRDLFSSGERRFW